MNRRAEAAGRRPVQNGAHCGRRGRGRAAGRLPSAARHRSLGRRPPSTVVHAGSDTPIRRVTMILTIGRHTTLKSPIDAERNSSATLNPHRRRRLVKCASPLLKRVHCESPMSLDMLGVDPRILADVESRVRQVSLNLARLINGRH
jgi:hypothetical protein